MTYFKIFLSVTLLTIPLSGCVGLSSITRMGNNMDQMSYYMGVMASAMPQMAFSTKRMADTAEGLQRKSDGIVSEFQKKGVSTEKAVQNYAQTFIDNDRAIIKNLQGIKEELAQLKQTQPLTKIPNAPSQNQEKMNSAILERISKLEAQIQALSSKMGAQSSAGPSAPNR
ncbi:MAG: hypothetical protein V1897_03700 [Pseudomonadota bacterium]